MSDPRWPSTGPTRRAFLAGLAAAVAVGCTPDEPQPNISLDRREIAYGADPLQVGDLTVPLQGGPHAVLVVIHGGYWKRGLDRQAMAPLVESLGRLGHAVWNIDYRTVGAGGGWPGTFADVAAAIDHVAIMAGERGLDPDRVVTVGHSAGGHLALWALARDRGAPVETQPIVPVRGAVSFAGIPDLAAAATLPGNGNAAELRRAVVDLLGGSPDQVPDRYAQASPEELVPLGEPQLLVHGTRDDRVPIDLARSYVTAAAEAGDPARLVEVPTGDHGDVVRDDRSAWPDVVAWLGEVLGAGADDAPG